jgi:hypothetical protein
MKHMLVLFLAFAAGGAVGCTEHADAVHDAVHGSGEHHPEAKGPTGEFHAVLAPIWHSEKSPARTTKACDAAKTMRQQAAAVETGAPPAGAKPEDFKASAKALTASVDALTAACAADGRPDVDAKLSDVHDAFHKVAEQGHGGHHDHDEKGHH